MSSAAARMRQYRARQKAGRTVLFVEVDEVLLINGLIEARLLAAEQSDDREAIRAATAQALRLFCGERG